MELFLFKNDESLTCMLPEKQQGQYWIMHKGLNGYEEKLLGIEGINNKWVLKSNKKAYLLNEQNEKVKELPLNPLEVYRVVITETNETVLLFSEPITEDRKVFHKVVLPVNGSLSIGRSEECDIQYKNKYVSGLHAKLTTQNGNVFIESLSQSNGTYVNGKQISSTKLNPGDYVYIVGLRFIVGDGFIALNNPDRNVTYNKVILQDYIKQNAVKVEDEFEDISDEDINTFNVFYRPPRITEKIEPLSIRVDEPSPQDNREETPLMLVLGPSLIMGLASLTTGLFTLQYALTNNGNLRFAIPALIMSVCMLIGTIVFPVLTRKHQRKKKQEREQLRKAKYSVYLEEIEREIEAARNEQKIVLFNKYTNVDACIEKIEGMHPFLWERTSEHDDFLELRLGIGTSPFLADIKFPEKRFKLEDDDLQDQMLEIVNRPKINQDVPVTLNFTKDYISGVIGSPEFLAKFTKNLLFQMVALHSYQDLKLVFLYDKKESDVWDFVKWFPHVWNETEDFRFIATNDQEIKELSTYLDRELSKRTALNESDLETITPHYVVIACDTSMALKAKFIENVLSSKKALGFSVIQLDGDYVNLPKECSAIVKQGKEQDEIFRRQEATQQEKFKAEFYEGSRELVIGKALANIRLVSSDASFALPERLTFLEMFEVGKIEHLNALSRWKQNDPTMNLEARIGVGTDGDWATLDLHEKFHGPHGLIAGMTGSGKSEFIMTYILSLAVNYHPDEVAFILIDYKGGGMANTFTNLPHVAGTITNLDGAAVNRSLVSIQSELKRRQAIFNEASKKLEVSNIDIYKYQKLYREGKVVEPLQHLFIISDEFAELKTQQPEFMAQLISTARIGRSLGVHLILATQKPSGVVDDQIWSNSKFRVSLKVQERADSMDVIKRPDAAELSVTGRYYLQVGYNELFEMGQSAWSGAPYYPSESVETTQIDSVAIINPLGHLVTEVRDDSRKQVNPNAPKQIDEITKYLANIALEENIKVRPIWLDPIPALIYIDELYKKYEPAIDKNRLNPIIGELDDPVNQRQIALHLPLTAEGNTIIYGAAGSGKTTFLTTILYTMMENHTPDEVNFYILDFSAETLRPFKDAPHVGDVIISDEAEKVQNLFKMLVNLVQERKKLFANFGGDYESYVSNSADEVPAIVVMIHNFAAFSDLYNDYEEVLTNLARDGMKYGIYFILTSISPSGVRYRVQQNFKQLFVLQLNDQSDYSSILGSVGGVYPSKSKGRGILKDTQVYEFQIANAFEQATFQQFKTYCAQVKERYPNMKAKRVPVLPEMIDLHYLEDCGVDFQRNEIPVGMNKKTLQLAYYNLEKQSIHAVFYKYEESSAFTQYLAEVISRNNSKQLIVIDAIQSFDQEKVTNYQYYNSQFDAAIVDMFNTLVERNNTYKDAIEAGEEVPKYENVTYMIQSLAKLQTLLSADSIEKFNLLIERAEKAYNVTFILCDLIDQANQYTNKQWYKKFGSETTALWLGNGISAQYVLKPAQASRLNADIGSDFGYTLNKGEAQLIKLATLNDAVQTVGV